MFKKNKYNRSMDFVIVITILVLILFFTNKIDKGTFLLLFAPLSIAMLILGLLKRKRILNDIENMDSHIAELKNRIKK